MDSGIIEMLPAGAPPPGSGAFPWGMYQWGLAVIRVIQTVESPALTRAVQFITALGTEALYVPLILAVFWWIDETRGLRLGILVIFSAWVNQAAKDLLKQPRPFNLEPALGKAFEPTYGAPSGHAQGTLVFWVPMAAWLGTVWKEKRALIRAGAAAFILIIGLTRLYLGVHFPTDLFAGWALGGIILLLWFTLGPRIEKALASAGARGRNISAALAAFAMNGLYPQDRALPALFLGFTLGYTLMKERFPFSARAGLDGKQPGPGVMFLRCLTGFLGVALIHSGLRLILPGEGGLIRHPQWGAASPLYGVGYFIRYAVTGFWVSAGAPRVFQLTGLASTGLPERDGAGPDSTGNTPRGEP